MLTYREATVWKYRSVKIETSGMVSNSFSVSITASNLRSGSGGYYLSKPEISNFRRFWHKFQVIMGAEYHYLQIPVRRLRAAGTKAEKEDALVDYVVGLEALLGIQEERTELGYRFRIRGSVVRWTPSVGQDWGIIK